MITVKVFKLPHPVVTKVYMVYRGQRGFVSWIFTSCKKLHCSENTCITVMVGNQTTIFFLLYKTISDTLHFIQEPEHFFKSKITTSWQNRRMRGNTLCNHPQQTGTGRSGTTSSHHTQGISSWSPFFGEGWEKADGQNHLQQKKQFAISITKLLLWYHNTLFKQLITNLLNIRASLRLLEIIV